MKSQIKRILGILGIGVGGVAALGTMGAPALIIAAAGGVSGYGMYKVSNTDYGDEKSKSKLRTTTLHQSQPSRGFYDRAVERRKTREAFYSAAGEMARDYINRLPQNELGKVRKIKVYPRGAGGGSLELKVDKGR